LYPQKQREGKKIQIIKGKREGEKKSTDSQMPTEKNYRSANFNSQGGRGHFYTVAGAGK